MKINAFFITLFGCGNFKKAPGTIASFATMLIWFLVSYLINAFNFLNIKQQFIFWIFVCISAFIYGVIFIEKYQEEIKSHDHPSIVIDEFVGQLIAIILCYPFFYEYFVVENIFANNEAMFLNGFMSFLLFRFFDIKKPFFIGWVDKNVNGSIGVMLDDLLAGVAAAAINFLIFKYFFNFS